MNAEDHARLLAFAHRIAGNLGYTIRMEGNVYTVIDDRNIFRTDDIYILCNFLLDKQEGIVRPDLMETGRMDCVERLLRHFEK